MSTNETTITVKADTSAAIAELEQLRLKLDEVREAAERASAALASNSKTPLSTMNEQQAKLLLDGAVAKFVAVNKSCGFE